MWERLSWVADCSQVLPGPLKLRSTTVNRNHTSFSAFSTPTPELKTPSSLPLSLVEAEMTLVCSVQDMNLLLKIYIKK